MKYISILGSTGSIGTQALDVIRQNEDFKVDALSTNTNIDLLEKQITEFNPKVVAVANIHKAKELRERMKFNSVEVLEGLEGLIEVATYENSDILLTSVVGNVGLKPTLEAIKAKKTIALANKETLVTAGQLVMSEAKKYNVNIIPVDSEHSAIFQSMKSGKYDEIRKLILTASGGPFRGSNKEQLKTVKPEDALKHPNWDMGKKISIDSATLMNKGLEVIEAKWLFDIDVKDIEVLIHPQSIIHSMVEFIDGSVIAQLGISDMKIPIQYALTYPLRKPINLDRLDLIEIGKLTFEAPDTKNFPCIEYAFEAIKEGGTMPTVLNAANEVAVEKFLENRITFNEIPKYIYNVMNKHKSVSNPNLNDILEYDNWARNMFVELLK